MIAAIRILRLVYGAGLDRLLADRGLRARLGRRLRQIKLSSIWISRREKLDALDLLFGRRALPTELGLAFVGNAGVSR